MKNMKKPEKTNVMRLLDQQGLPYAVHDYSHTDALSGAEVASVLGQDPERVFKTLVTVGRSGQHYVFVIPVLRELDLKKAAAASGEKSIAMVKSKELLPLTGYIHGGCSPIGMKKTPATRRTDSPSPTNAASAKKTWKSNGSRCLVWVTKPVSRF